MTIIHYHFSQVKPHHKKKIVTCRDMTKSHILVTFFLHKTHPPCVHMSFLVRTCCEGLKSRCAWSLYCWPIYRCILIRFTKDHTVCATKIYLRSQILICTPILMQLYGCGHSAAERSLFLKYFLIWLSTRGLITKFNLIT